MCSGSIESISLRGAPHHNRTRTIFSEWGLISPNFQTTELHFVYQNWLLSHLEEVMRMFNKLRSVQIYPGAIRNTQRPRRTALEEEAQAILATKIIRPSLMKVIFHGGANWQCDDWGRWRIEDSWGTKYCPSPASHAARI